MEWGIQEPMACIRVGGTQGVHIWVWQLWSSLPWWEQDNQGNLLAGLCFFLKTTPLFSENLENTQTISIKNSTEMSLYYLGPGNGKRHFEFPVRQWLDQSLPWPSGTLGVLFGRLKVHLLSTGAQIDALHTVYIIQWGRNYYSHFIGEKSEVREV